MEVQNLDITQVTANHLAQYRTALSLPGEHPNYLFKKPNISEQTRYQTLACAVRFLEWLTDINTDVPIVTSRTRSSRYGTRGMLKGIVRDQLKPLKDRLLKTPKRRLPKNIRDTDIEKIREWINSRWKNNPHLRSRNRTMFEVFLATGLRLGELVSIRIEDIDDDADRIQLHYDGMEYRQARLTGKRTAHLKTGERTVAVSQNAMRYINEYIVLHRPRVASRYKHGRLFCTHQAPRTGHPMTVHAVEYFFRLIKTPEQYGGCGIDVSAHKTRHTHATQARQNGADTRAVQKQLGHIDASTTEIYDAFVPELRRPLLDRVTRKSDEW